MADKRIKLIVTGDSEKKSLHESLQKCFPTHTSTGDFVIWDVPRKAIHGGATSSRLIAGAPSLVSMTNLVKEMFSEALASKKPNGSPPDFVIVIDDVELGNVGQEAVVVQSFRAAVSEKLAELKTQNTAAQFQKIQTRIQTCCSFHMLCPMVEAYFFADPATLSVGGVAVNPVLTHASDVEQFDAAHDSNLDWQSLCSGKNLQQASVNNSWWRTERHPKIYLEQLLRISNAPEYHETTLGARMIQATNWATVAKSSMDSPVISALFEDIWDWFGSPRPMGQFLGAPSTTTYRVRTARPNQRLLRNI